MDTDSLDKEINAAKTDIETVSLTKTDMESGSLSIKTYSDSGSLAKTDTDGFSLARTEMEMDMDSVSQAKNTNSRMVKRSIISTACTLGFGISVAGVQIGLCIGASATNWFLDRVIYTKNAGNAVVSKCMAVERSLESRVYDIIRAVNGNAKKIRDQLEAIYTTPGDVVVGLIRDNSAKLNEQLGLLRDRGTELLNASALNCVESALGYVQKLDGNIAKANRIEDVQSEIFEEAKQKFEEIFKWSGSMMDSLKAVILPKNIGSRN